MMKEQLEQLKQEIQSKLEYAHNQAKLYQVESPDWSFYVGQMDGLSSARYRIQQIIESLE